MSRGAAATSVQDALNTLQIAVLAFQKQQNSAGSSVPESASISSALSQLSVGLQDLVQRQSALEQSLEDRIIAERALHRVVANKDAQAVRLQSEVARLRHRLSAAEAAAADETAAGAEAGVPDAAGRQALLDAAVAAKKKPIATVLQLESEVAACQARIATLQAELSAAAADNSSRLAEQQKAFLAKLEQLRQVHAQQIAAAAAAEATAKDASQQQQARCQALEQPLAQSKQQQEQQQVLIASLQQQLAEAQRQSSRSPAVAAAAASAPQQDGSMYKPGSNQQRGTAAAPRSSGSTIKTAEQAARATADVVTSKAAEAVGLLDRSCADQAANHEVAALQLMEGQLVRLSGIIKSHQEEIAQLRSALMASCAERQQLQQQQQHAAGAVASVTLAACGAAAVGGSSKPLKAAATGVKGRAPAAAAVARSASKNVRGA